MPARISIETYLYRMRRCAEKGDAEGMLFNLKLATTCALEDNPDAMTKASPRTLLEIVQAENTLMNKKLKAEKEAGTEDDDDFFERLNSLEQEPDNGEE